MDDIDDKKKPPPLPPRNPEDDRINDSAEDHVKTHTLVAVSDRSQQPPSIGRIVHFLANVVGPPYVGIITRVHENDRVALATFGSDSIHFNPNVPFAAVPTPGHWSWPPRIG